MFLEGSGDEWPLVSLWSVSCHIGRGWVLRAMVLTASLRYTSRYFGNRTVKVDSSAKVPPALSSRLKAGISHLLMSSVSHLERRLGQQLGASYLKKKESMPYGLSFSCFVDILAQVTSEQGQRRGVVQTCKGQTIEAGVDRQNCLGRLFFWSQTGRQELPSERRVPYRVGT